MVLNQSFKVLCMAVHGNLTTIRNRESNKYIGVTIRKLQCTGMHSMGTCSFYPLDETALGALNSQQRGDWKPHAWGQ